jgi:hypothetical protein
MTEGMLVKWQQQRRDQHEGSIALGCDVTTLTLQPCTWHTMAILRSAKLTVAVNPVGPLTSYTRDAMP